MTGQQVKAVTIESVSSMADVDAGEWNALLGSRYPFLRHEFLHALEVSGAVSEQTGWIPAHLVARREGQLVAAMPLYEKHHSRGEYVFDYQWADAWERAGGRYYPKLLSAVPFSPVTGPRILASDPASAQQLIEVVTASVLQHGLSGAHLLFPQPTFDQQLEESGWLLRLGCQYHWHNRGYHRFEDFLAVCTSRKRKNFRKERAQVTAQGISFRAFRGEEVDERLWRQFFAFYAATYLKRGQRPYLSLAFFLQLAEHMAESIRLVVAYAGEQEVAAAFFLTGGNTLYGRYWGCLDEYDKLHFETCFYQGIDLCIAEGLAHFDAGAQGEHKLIRGFEPQLTSSWHLLQPGLHEAVEEFLLQERAAIHRYYADALSYLPYRNEDSSE